jgi:hypothetical protein
VKASTRQSSPEIEVQPVGPGRQEQHDRAAQHESEHDAGAGADHGDEKTFGQRLRHQPLT